MNMLTNKKLNITIEIDGNEVNIAEESSSGCFYRVFDLSGLLNVISDYVSDFYIEENEDVENVSSKE